MKAKLFQHKHILWYALATMLLGLIDQRRGSARGETQMLFSNLIGVSIFMMVLPSMKITFWKERITQIAGGIGMLVSLICIWVGRMYVTYKNQWITVIIGGYCIYLMLLYLFRYRKEIFGNWKIFKIMFGIVMLSLFFMLVSENKALWPGYYLLLFGCFYLIGIPDDRHEDFLLGLLWGLVGWFFIQQSLAFAYRPYDYLRYRGLYSGETQNGVFYMIAFCAFTGLWLFSRKKVWNKFAQAFFFLMSAGCVSLLLLTGGKSPLLGCVAGAAIGYFLYDLYMKKSLKHWLFQGLLVGICTIALFPAAYGCVRYLPTILHHPIWFEGEYNANTSVHSFDPWNSERYTSLEEALNITVRRMTRFIGVDIYILDGKLHIQTPFSMKADAATPGSSADNPYYTDINPVPNANPFQDTARTAIWKYYFQNLNFKGHTNLEFYYTNEIIFYDTHNIFLQIAYSYGIVAGILFVSMFLSNLIHLSKRKDMTGLILAMLLISIISYGMFEQAVTFGQITLSLLFIINYFSMQRKL